MAEYEVITDTTQEYEIVADSVVPLETAVVAETVLTDTTAADTSAITSADTILSIDTTSAITPADTIPSIDTTSATALAVAPLAVASATDSSILPDTSLAIDSIVKTPTAQVIPSGVEPLIIATIPAGAEIYEKDSLLGVTPFSYYDSVISLHTVTLKYPDHRDTTFNAVSTPRALKILNIGMKSRNGKTGTYLFVKAKSPDAKIYVNDSLYGTDSIKVEDLPAGKQIVKISGEWIETFTDTVNLRLDQEVALTIPVHSRSYTAMGASFVNDFTPINFMDDTVLVEEHSYILNHDDPVRNQWDFNFFVGKSYKTKRSGLNVLVHIPHRDTFYTVAEEDESDTLHMNTLTYGGGLFREQSWIVASVPGIFEFDMGLFWGVSAKVRQYKYASQTGSGGVGDIVMENNKGEDVFPMRGYVSIGGVSTNIRAGFHNVFLTAGYQFHPAASFDGIRGYPSNPVSFLPISKLSLGLSGKF